MARPPARWRLHGRPRRERLRATRQASDGRRARPIRESGNRCSRARRRSRCGRSRTATGASASASSLQRVDRDIGLQPPRLHVLDRLLRRRPQHLAAPHQHRVEHAVAERMAAQRDEPLRDIFRETASRRCAACRNIRRSRPSCRSRCRRQAAASAAGSADFPSSARRSGPRPRPRCGPFSIRSATPISCAAIITLRT